MEWRGGQRWVNFHPAGLDRPQLQGLVGSGAEFLEQTGVAWLFQILIIGGKQFLHAGAAGGVLQQLRETLQE
jgi:hypothetical protein